MNNDVNLQQSRVEDLQKKKVLRKARTHIIG